MKNYLRLFIIFPALSTTMLSAAVHYVNVNSSSAVAPYSSWDTAASTIQDAIDAATGGDEILVTNGIYATGGKVVSGRIKNRVALIKPLVVRSINGPEVTIIQGFQVPGMTNGAGAVRCGYIANGATLSGFTITNGATLPWTIETVGCDDICGGGLRCEPTAVVSNCIVVNNSAAWSGGGVIGGNLLNCSIIGNAGGSGGGGRGMCGKTGELLVN